MKTAIKSGLIIVTVFFISSFFLTSSCDALGEKGNGKVSRQERKVDSFNALEVGGGFDVFLTQGTPQSVIIEADENLMDVIETEVQGNTLKISNNRSIKNAKSLKIFITVPEITSLELSGAVDLQTQNKLTGSTIEISISGASDSKVELAVQHLVLGSSGGSKIQLIGSASNVKMDVSGAVDVHAFDLLTDKFDLDMSGAGEAEINVKNELIADISGAASVRYRGDPPRVMEDVSGAGSVRKAE